MTTCTCGAHCPGIMPSATTMLEEMAADLLRESGETVEFACPLCLRVLPPTCASEAHAPSRKLGGRVVTLLCRHCNEELARLYESAVVPALMEEAKSGEGTILFRARAGSGEPGRSKLNVPMRWRTEGGRITEVHIGRATGGPAVRARWREELDRMIASRAGAFDGSAASPGQHRRALLGWAYQAAVGRLGYRFALSPGARFVADALLDPESSALGNGFRIFLDGSPATDLTPSLPVWWSMAGLAGQLDGWGWRFGGSVAVLPYPWDEDGETYRALDSVIADGTATGITLGEAADGLLEAIFQTDATA